MEPFILILLTSFPRLSLAASTFSWVRDDKGSLLFSDCQEWVLDVQRLSGTLFTPQTLQNLSQRGSKLNSALDTYLKHSG